MLTKWILILAGITLLVLFFSLYSAPAEQLRSFSLQGILAPKQHTYCTTCEECTTLLASGLYDIVELDQHILDVVGNCIDPAGSISNVTFDCAGHQIIGVGAPEPDRGAHGITISGGSDVAIQNCIISNFFDDGIVMENTNNYTLMNNSLVENGIGLLLVSSQDTTINLNTFCDNRDEDIKVVGGSGNFGDDNSCDFPDGWNDVGETGCTSLCSGSTKCWSCNDCTDKLDGSYHRVILGNNIQQIAAESCILFGASDVELNCNDYQINGSGEGAGIQIAYAQNNKVERCIINNFDYGISLLEAQSNVIRKNEVNGVDNWGIWLNNSSQNYVVNNEINSSDLSGINLFNSSDNWISSNTIISSSFGSSLSYAINLYEAHSNTLQFNTLTDNRAGIELLSSNSNTLFKNYICSVPPNIDINLRTGYGNTGDSNECDQTVLWNDEGSDGCTNTCLKVLDFEPNSGFSSVGEDIPPEQLVPGTTVTVTGLGFSRYNNIAVYFDDVPMEPTRSQVINDTEIVAVVGTNTPPGSNPLCVGNDDLQVCSTNLFDVEEAGPFPARWGLGFDNFSTPSSDMSWHIFEWAFGECEVNTCVTSYLGIPIPCKYCPDWLRLPRPDTFIFFAASQSIAKDGDCYGMSYLILDFLMGALDPAQMALGAEIPGNLSWGTPDLADAIRARQWRQLSLEFILEQIDIRSTYAALGPLGMLDNVEMLLNNGGHGVLCIEDKMPGEASVRGHCLVPYMVDDRHIYIYDPNFPYINNNHPDPETGCFEHDYLDQAMERFINVESDGWQYESGVCEPARWTGGRWASYFTITPYSVVAGPHHPLTDILGLDIIFWGGGSGYSSVEDSEGRLIGIDASGEFTQTIPINQAVPIIPFQDATSPFEGYYLSTPDDYTVHISGTASGAYSLTLFADRATGLVLRDVPLSTSTRDNVICSQAEGSPTGERLFTLNTNDSAKPYDVELLRTVLEGSEQRTYALNNLAVGAGMALSITTAPEGGGILSHLSDGGADSLVISGGANSAYDICLGKQATGQPPAKYCWSDIDFQGGDRHVLTPSDWDNLSSSGIRLDIDQNNDGSIDDTQLLLDYGVALSMQAEPAVIEPGDWLTFTLNYTVTGYALAPGVVLTTTIPMGTSYVDATGNPIHLKNLLIWSLGDLMPPTSGQVSFTVVVGQVPEDAVVGTIAYLHTGGGRRALASVASVGPHFAFHRVFLPLVSRD